MGFEDVCNISLGLGLGCQENILKMNHHHQVKKSSSCFSVVDHHLFPTSTSLTLGLSEETYKEVDVHVNNNNNNNNNKGYNETGHVDLLLQRQASPHTPVSSFSNASIKREREQFGSEEMEVERVFSRASDEDEEASGRKKLRLTKEQSALLEESFKEHSTLNPKQKQALAKQLKLRPRQVEVWFQNRRARTKLKQTEVDCEFLKKCCESLTDENRRLQKELHELKALKLAPPLYMQLPAATLTMCPSCERIGGGGNGGGGGSGGEQSSSKNQFIITPKPHFYNNPFSHPSAAC